MFSTKLSVLAAALSFGLFAAGCAAESTEPTGSSDSEVRTTQTVAEVDVQDGSFKLYEDPASKPSDACDIHTVLTLTHEESGIKATLRDVVTGVCFLYVKPNERTYRLDPDMNRCGTQTFSGETSVEGETRHIAITDYRRSLCENKSKAELVVDEYDQSGVVTTRYTQQ